MQIVLVHKKTKKTYYVNDCGFLTLDINKALKTNNFLVIHKYMRKYNKKAFDIFVVNKDGVVINK